MNWIKGAFDSFRIEEAYNWRDDIMEITRRIVHETDEAWFNNIAEHFEADLSEIRDFLEMKRKKMQKPQTNADRIRGMTDEELAEFLGKVTAGGYGMCAPGHYDCTGKDSCAPCWLDWLKEEGER